MMNPKPFRTAHVMQIRFSHARLSSTVRPEREKFIIRSATEAVTMAATVEMRRIWLYTSFMISLAFVHTFAPPFSPANTGCVDARNTMVPR